MRIYALPSAVLDRFESSGVTMDFLPAAAESATTRVTVARIGPGGTLGAHAATLTQAFAVIEGDGHVAVAEGDPWRVGPGMVVVWEAGEVHTTQAATAMLAVIVETSGRLELPEHYRPLARPGGLV